MTTANYEVFSGVITWKMLFSGSDKNVVRGTLLGEIFPRWGEGINKFWLAWVQHLFIYTYPILFRHSQLTVAM